MIKPLIFKSLSLFVLSLCFRCQLVLAQVTTGNISGTIKDETGGVVPGAAVIVKNLDTGITRAATADTQGRYQALSLPVGNYEVQATMAGFQAEVRRGILLTIGRDAVVAAC